MSSFVFGLGLLWFMFGYKLIAIYLEQRSERESATAEHGLSDEVAERFAEGENRVQVLERIVTDQRFDLKREFEDLGD